MLRFEFNRKSLNGIYFGKHFFLPPTLSIETEMSYFGECMPYCSAFEPSTYLWTEIELKLIQVFLLLLAWYTVRNTALPKTAVPVLSPLGEKKISLTLWILKKCTPVTQYSLHEILRESRRYDWTEWDARKSHRRLVRVRYRDGAVTLQVLGRRVEGVPGEQEETDQEQERPLEAPHFVHDWNSTLFQWLLNVPDCSCRLLSLWRTYKLVARAINTCVLTILEVIPPESDQKRGFQSHGDSTTDSSH